MIEHVTNYLADARTKLLEQFKGLPRIDALLQAYMAEVQALEDAAWDVFVSRILSNGPTGDLEDKLGALVGEPRNGASDADYATYIAARIATNRSDGKHETLLAICELLMPTVTPITFREYVKAIEIEVNDLQGDAYVIFHDFLSMAKAAGTSLRFISSDVAQTSTLTYSSVYGGVTTVTGQRMSSVYGGGGAGVFANVFGEG